MFKKSTNKFICIILVLILLLLHIPDAIFANDSEMGEENYQLFCTECTDEGIDSINNYIPTINDNFRDDRINIVFKHAYSVPNKIWKPENFPGINIESIKDGTF